MKSVTRHESGCLTAQKQAWTTSRLIITFPFLQLSVHLEQKQCNFHRSTADFWKHRVHLCLSSQLWVLTCITKSLITVMILSDPKYNHSRDHAERAGEERQLTGWKNHKSDLLNISVLSPRQWRGFGTFTSCFSDEENLRGDLNVSCVILIYNCLIYVYISRRTSETELSSS